MTNKMQKMFRFSEKNTFCISLKDNEYRWIKMKDRFERDTLSVRKWNACTPSKITDKFIDSLSPVQKACAQSHINIWKHMVKYSLEYALILEDDACFDRNWRIRFQEFIDANIDPEWDAIFFNASEPVKPAYKWVEAKGHVLAAGYILSLRGAKVILEKFKDCFCASDWMTLTLQERGHSYTYFPWLIIQEGHETQLGSNYQEEYQKVKRCLGEIGYSLDNYML
jgi:GR25 family glycosyltransferase involved in LPS biosynthesis